MEKHMHDKGDAVGGRWIYSVMVMPIGPVVPCESDTEFEKKEEKKQGEQNDANCAPVSIKKAKTGLDGNSGATCGSDLSWTFEGGQ
jgi:hypothetical protein